MSNNPLDAGQVSLNRAVLVTSSGTEISFIEYIKQIDIVEDIEKPVMHGKILVSEYLNLVDSLPIIGEEFLVLEYEIIGEEKTIELEFRVNQVYNFNKPKDKQFEYELTIISPEYYPLIQRSMETASTQLVEGTVSKIMKDIIGTEKNILVDPTEAPQHIVFVGNSLYDSIKYCTFRAQSKNTEDSLYKFFETRDGFNFRCVGSLAKQEPTLYINYFNKQAKDPKGNSLATFSALSYSVESKNDTARTTINGGYRNALFAFDPLIKKGKYFERNYFDDFDLLANVETKKSSTPLFRDIAAAEGAIDYAFITNLRDTPREKSTGDNVSDMFPSNVEDYYLQRQMSRVRLNDTIINIDIPLTTFIQAGDVIFFEIPRDNGMQDQEENDRFISGKYIITELRHSFSQEKGLTSIKCKKSGLSESIERAD